MAAPRQYHERVATLAWRAFSPKGIESMQPIFAAEANHLFSHDSIGRVSAPISTDGAVGAIQPIAAVSAVRRQAFEQSVSGPAAFPHGFQGDGPGWRIWDTVHGQLESTPTALKGLGSEAWQFVLRTDRGLVDVFAGRLREPDGTVAVLEPGQDLTVRGFRLRGHLDGRLYAVRVERPRNALAASHTPAERPVAHLHVTIGPASDLAEAPTRYDRPVASLHVTIGPGSDLSEGSDHLMHSLAAPEISTGGISALTRT